MVSRNISAKIKIKTNISIKQIKITWNFRGRVLCLALSLLQCSSDVVVSVCLFVFFYRHLFIYLFIYLFPIMYLTRLIFRKKHFPNFQGVKEIFHGAIRNARKPLSHNSASLM